MMTEIRMSSTVGRDNGAVFSRALAEAPARASGERPDRRAAGR